MSGLHSASMLPTEPGGSVGGAATPTPADVAGATDFYGTDPSTSRWVMASVVRGALHFFSTQPITWAASLVWTVFIPRYLGAQRLGTFSVILTAFGLLGTAITLGVPSYLTRRIATHGARASVEAGAALVLLTATSSLGAVALFLALPHIPLPIPLTLMRIGLVGMVLGTAGNIPSAMLVGQERHARFAWLNAGATAVGTGVSIGLLKAGGGLVALMLAGLAMGVVSFAVAWRLSGFRLQRAAFDLRLYPRLARAGLPFLVWNLAIQIRAQIDVVLVGTILSAEAAGWLAAAYRIIFVPTFIPTLIVMPLLPALSRVANDRAVFLQVLRRSALAVLIMTVPCAAGITALAPDVPKLLHWPADFQGAVPLMVILASEQPLVALDTILGTALLALHDEHRWLRVGVVATIFNPVMNLFMLPLLQRATHNGAVGATIVELATEVLLFVGALILLPRGTVDRQTAGAGARTILAGIAVALAAWVVRPWSLPLAVVAGVAVYAVATWALRLLRPSDLRDLFELARQPIKPRLAGVES